MKCEYFKGCGAPLCPLDEDTVLAGIWFVTDEVCRRALADWVKKQHALLPLEPTGYFTLDMLKALTPTPGITGLTAHGDKAPSLEREWIRHAAG